jgi:hypothetical protein
MPDPSYKTNAKTIDFTKWISSKKFNFSNLTYGELFYAIYTTRVKKYEKRPSSAKSLKKYLSIDTNFDPC